MSLAHRDEEHSNDQEYDLDRFLEDAKKGCEVLARIGLARRCEKSHLVLAREGPIAIIYYSVFLAAKYKKNMDNPEDFLDSITSAIYLLAHDSGKKITREEALYGAAAFILAVASVYSENNRRFEEFAQLLNDMVRKFVDEKSVYIISFSDDEASINGAKLASRILNSDFDRFVDEFRKAVIRRRREFIVAVLNHRYIDALKTIIADAVKSIVGREGEDVDVAAEYLTYINAAQLRAEKRLVEFLLVAAHIVGDYTLPGAS